MNPIFLQNALEALNVTKILLINDTILLAEILGKTVFLGYMLSGSVCIHSNVQKCTENILAFVFIVFELTS